MQARIDLVIMHRALSEGSSLDNYPYGKRPVEPMRFMPPLAGHLKIDARIRAGLVDA